MTMSDAHEGRVILVDIFLVNPVNQQKLVDLLTCATDEFVRDVPGFVSSRLHRSLDGKKVAMYAEWRSIPEYQAMRGNPESSFYLEEALSIATLEPGNCEVVGTLLSSRAGKLRAPTFGSGVGTKEDGWSMCIENRKLKSNSSW